MTKAAASSSTPQLVLVRHGETEWSATGRHTGRTDLSLTAAGRDQARNAGEFLARRRMARGHDFAVGVSSPLERARQTAALAGYPQASVDPDLAEWDYGPVEGYTTAQMSDQWGRPWQIFRDGVNVMAGPQDRKGEDLSAVADRAEAALSRIQPTLDMGGDVLIVAHGHFLRIMTSVWLSLDPEFAQRLELGTAAICILGFNGGLRTIEGWNLGIAA